MTTHENIRDYVITWNSRFPMDKWWRDKHSVPFNSPDHRKSCFIDQLFEWEEDKLFSELQRENEYIPNTGDWIKQKEVTIENLADSIEDFRNELRNLGEDDG